MKTYEYLIGREIGERFPKRDVKIGEEVLKVEGLSSGKYFQNVSFSVRAGEVLGVAGIGFVTEDRKTEGLLLEKSIAENIEIANLGKVSDKGVLKKEKQQSIVKRGIEEFRIKCFGPWHECYGKHAAGQWGYPGCFCGQ